MSEIYNFNQLPPYSHIVIYDIQGRMIKDVHTGDIPQALDLSDIGRGVFFVKVNGVTYKIVRK